MNKAVNVLTSVILGGLLISVFILIQKSSESNENAVSAVKIGVSANTKTLREVRLMTLELRNLQKDVSEIRTILPKTKRVHTTIK